MGLTFWIVFDEAIVREAPAWAPAWGADDLRRAAAEGKLLHRADSIPELATIMGVSEANLTAALEGYNRGVATGAPDPLGREHRPLTVAEPPFYAAKMHAYTNLSWAGLRVNADLAVLQADGTPIEGLYAVGEILGFSTFSGRAFVGGMSLGPAMSLGRYLGQRLGAAASQRA
jgi:fumarate reductase flavoprotein subunit